MPARVRTGLTDLDYSEVVSGLKAGDSVLVLPSASLINSQQEFKNRMTRHDGSAACRACASDQRRRPAARRGRQRRQDGKP